MKYVHGLLYDTERTGAEIGAKMRESGMTAPLLEALARIEALPADTSAADRQRAMQREGAAALAPFKGSRGLRELAEGFAQPADDLEFIGMTLLRMLELGKRDFFNEQKN